MGEREKPAPVPLTGVGVHVRIIDLVAEVKIEQIYENNSSQPIETTYTFPLEKGLYLNAKLIFVPKLIFILIEYIRSRREPVHGRH